MKTAVLLFDKACIYEIVTLNYFLSFSGRETVFVSVDGAPIVSMEGYSVNVSGKLGELDPKELEMIVVPGGPVRQIDNEDVYAFLNAVKAHNGLIAAICAGVDVLDHAGILADTPSTHSTEHDVVVTEKVITSRANGYIDFAIEVAKKLKLFIDEADLQETISFWKGHARMQ